jgi:hypothetical protein
MVAAAAAAVVVVPEAALLVACAFQRGSVPAATTVDSAFAVAALRGGSSRAALAKTENIKSPLEQWWYSHIPSLIRYLVSGNLGNICFFLCERLLSSAVDDHYHLLPALAQQLLDLPFRDSVSFVTAYMVHVPAQHYLHALLVYGLESIDTAPKYWQTLGGTYSALITSCFGSTVLHHLLIQAWGAQYKTIAFVATLWTFSVFNFFVIGWVVRRTATSQRASEANDSAAQVPMGRQTATSGPSGSFANNIRRSEKRVLSNPLLNSNKAVLL